MDHPLLHQTQKEKRQRVVTHLKQAYNIRKNSNIIFVCGGNGAAALRTKFIDFCKEQSKDIHLFLPEYAMPTALGSGVEEQFDLSEFEEVVAELSHSIIIFPEAPGSYAEAGYFSAREEVSKNCILALNNKHQNDSFLSLGPALRIERSTIFRPNIQIDYENPIFDDLLNKIRSRNFSNTLKRLSLDDLSNLTAYEICGVIFGIVDLLTIATIDDVLNFFKVISGNRFKKNRVRQFFAILVGAKFLQKIGEYDHVCINRSKPKIIHTISGYIEQESLLKLELQEFYQSECTDFARLLEGIHK